MSKFSKMSAKINILRRIRLKEKFTDGQTDDRRELITIAHLSNL